MLRNRYFGLILVLNIFGTASSILGQIPAFPGAEGYGSSTPGGRGGQVIKVTNLNDNGPGSLRTALQTSGPRIIVFDTGGTIELTSRIKVVEPYLTVAGQTAPGDGIAVTGDWLWVQTHDVIIRGLRWRSGDIGCPNVCGERDCISVGNPDGTAHNVIVDHVSMSWSTDEIVSTWYQNTYDITFQWCIFGEPLLDAYPSEKHSRAFLLGDHSQYISVHHNLFAHANKRSPEVKGGTTSEVINNVMYNWGKYATLFCDWEGSGPIQSNHINNYAIRGPNTPYSDCSVEMWPGKDASTMPEGTKLYIKGNIGPYRPKDSPEYDDWLVVYYKGYDDVSKYRSDTLVVPPSGITILSAKEAKDQVLQYAGALNPFRDPVDQRIVNDVLNGTGRIVSRMNSLSSTEKWMPSDPGTSLTDTDNDGMPDDWETERSLDPNVDDSAGDRNGDGYTNIEEYINSLIPFYDTTAVNVSRHAKIMPSDYLLLQNFPNPFNPSTIISYSLPVAGRVKLTVYNIKANKVAVLVNRYQYAGKYSYEWEAINTEGRQLPSGAYLCRIQIGSYVKTIKMVYVR